MNDVIVDEQTPFDGEVPTLDVPSREDGEISESEDEVDADASLPDARDNLGPEETLSPVQPIVSLDMSSF